MPLLIPPHPTMLVLVIYFFGYTLWCLVTSYTQFTIHCILSHYYKFQTNKKYDVILHYARAMQHNYTGSQVKASEGKATT